MKSLTLTAAAAAMALASSASALERTATNDQTKIDVGAIEMRLDAKLAGLQTLLNRLVICNTKGRLYSSNAAAPGRDADGCVAIPTGSLAYANTYTQSGTGNSAVANHTVCALSRVTFGTNEDNHSHTCRITRSGAGYQLRSTISPGSNTVCEMICFDAN